MQRRFFHEERRRQKAVPGFFGKQQGNGRGTKGHDGADGASVKGKVPAFHDGTPAVSGRDRSRDPLEGRFSREQKLAYGFRAAECGRSEAQLILGKTDVWDIAARMGLKVLTPQVPGGGGHVIFAQYQEPDSITIFMDGAERAQKLIREEKLEGLLGNRAVEDVLLAHELFHVTEYRKRDCIFTQTEKVELWKKPFSNRSRILCLGEIAGMEFARCLTGITCTPYVLDVLMMYGYDKEAATALYEEIAAFAGNGEGKEG